MTRTLLLGAVAYDPKVVTIWHGFRGWFQARDFAFDFVLYSNYERQVVDLLDERIDVAWNSPLAWVRSRRLAVQRGVAVRAVAMRDTDRDLTSVIAVRADGPVQKVSDLVGCTVATGALDSPQATLLPLAVLSARGFQPGRHMKVRHFDVGVGLHGDHIGGERDAARALGSGQVDAACLTDSNLLLFIREGTIRAGSVRVLAQTERYDHCNMTTGPSAPAVLVARFVDLLQSMFYGDSQVRPLLDLEGLGGGYRAEQRDTRPWNAPLTRAAFTTPKARSVSPTIDLDVLGVDAGGYLLVGRALAGLPIGGRLVVTGSHPELRIHLAAWCRRQGHGLEEREGKAVVIRGSADEARWTNAERAGSAAAGLVEAWADPRWGLAARGALVEAGAPPLSVDLLERDLVWTDLAPRMYAQAAANQWDPTRAVDWTATVDLPPEVEAAVVQVMTFLVENEQAALIVPARMLARLHPHFREVMQLLAIQAADEARHIEVFTRRALLHRDELGISGAGGRASLQTLLNEPDFALGSFLLSVLGEGTFLDLLWFLHRNAPDPVTARVARLALQDESRHVAFGVAHVTHTVRAEPAFLSRLRNAVEHRHDVLVDAAGLNEQVFDALVTLAAGAWTPEAITRGWASVQRLLARMDQGRRRRLVAIGFPADEAIEISALHTRNFM